MCAFLYPDEYLDSTYSIDFDQLYKEDTGELYLILITPSYHMERLRMSGRFLCLHI